MGIDLFQFRQQNPHLPSIIRIFSGSIGGIPNRIPFEIDRRQFVEVDELVDIIPVRHVVIVEPELLKNRQMGDIFQSRDAIRR